MTRELLKENDCSGKDSPRLHLGLNNLLECHRLQSVRMREKMLQIWQSEDNPQSQVPGNIGREARA
jgi:hypothetical protein